MRAKLVVSGLTLCVPLVGFTLYQAYITSHAEHTLARARGVVISDDLERYSDGDGMVTAYRPVVEFRPASGEVVRIVEDGTATREFQNGASVELIYDPTNPHGAHIHSFWRTWQEVLIGLGASLLTILGFAAVVILGSSKTRRRAEPPAPDRAPSRS